MPVNLLALSPAKLNAVFEQLLPAALLVHLAAFQLAHAHDNELVPVTKSRNSAAINNMASKKVIT